MIIEGLDLQGKSLVSSQKLKITSRDLLAHNRRHRFIQLLDKGFNPDRDLIEKW